MDLLDEDALVRILQEPKNALIKQYQKLFELDGVRLEFDEAAVRAVAHESARRKTGARGLRAIMEKSMMDLMYEIPSNEEITACHITKELVENKGQARLEANGETVELLSDLEKDNSKNESA